MKFLTGFAVLVLLTDAPAQPQHNRPVFEQLVIPGNIQSTEYADVIQDQEGLLWVVANGLHAYDGFRFVRYDTTANSRSLLNQEINCLLYDSVRRRLLIGTRNLGVVEYNYETNLLHALPAPHGTPIINHLAIDAWGTVWASSFNSGLFTIKNDTLVRADVKNYSSVRTSAILVDGNSLWVGDVRKLYVVQQNKVIDSLILSWDKVDFASQGRVTALHKHGSRLYIGTEKLGVLIYDTRQQKFIRYLGPSEPPFFNRINRIYTDRRGQVWILTKAGGIAICHPETEQLTTLMPSQLTSYSLSSHNCNAILEDKTGIIWIAASGALNKYDPDKVQFRHITHRQGDSISLSDKMVRCVYEDIDGTLIVGTDGGYLNFLNLNRQQNRPVKINVDGSPKNFMPASIEALDEQNLLIGTSAGLLVMDKQRQTFRYFDSRLPAVSRGMVRQLIKRDNYLYAIASGFLHIINLKTRQVAVFRNYNDGAGKVPVRGVSALYFDSFNRLWLGVQGGVSLLNADSTFTYFPIEPERTRPDGSYFMVLAMNEINGHLWISTFNYGIWKLRLTPTGQEKEVVQRVEIPGFNKNTIYCTLPDRQGTIWMTSNEGLLRYNPATGNLLTFLPEQGVQAMEFNRLAFTTARTGELVLGGIDGINIFRPEDIQTHITLPRAIWLYATHYRLADVPFYTNLRDKDELNLQKNQTSLAVYFLLPAFNTPRNFITEYFLEGHDYTWTEASGSEIALPNLKPGSYTLRLRTRINNRTTETKPLKINIPVPLWQQGWFIALWALFLIALTFSGFRVQAGISKRNKQRLENLLHQRTAEIEKSREELKALNEKKDLIFSILSHDLRSPLTTLQGFLSLLEENADKLRPEQIAAYARNIRNSVGSALDLVDNTLYWALSQTGSIQCSPASFSLNEVLNKIYHLYQLTASRKHVELRLLNNTNLQVYADENMVYVALRNVVSNAIKFTHEWKSVTIKCEAYNGQALIAIKDEGIGMSREYLTRLLGHQNVAIKKGTANERGTGLGLILCYKFIDLNNGRIEVTSEENRGTEFRIYLPLSDAGRK
ncbi:MAG: hybrid sensor histidine kinase/response regulator [Cyclobacteriaceae bacterium]|nr:MAG: hybrid sensor histidine kinase/response regulator [Cyclobacteriaceae bacterium]